MRAPFRVGALLASASLLVLAIALTPVAGASVVRDVPLDEMIARADVIVHGRVERIAPIHLRQGGRAIPFIETVVSVRETLRGAPGHALRLRESGGVDRGRVHRREGASTYRVHEEVVVFARVTPHGHETFGLSLGHVRVVRDAAGARAVRSAPGLRGPDGEAISRRDLGPLEAFLARIREAVR